MNIQRSPSGLVSAEVSAWLLSIVFPKYPDTSICHALPWDVVVQLSRRANP
jgi:hypothetical protein